MSFDIYLMAWMKPIISGLIALGVGAAAWSILHDAINYERLYDRKRMMILNEAYVPVGVGVKTRNVISVIPAVIAEKATKCLCGITHFVYTAYDDYLSFIRFL